MHTLSALSLHKKFLSGELSATEITSHFLARIEKHNDSLGAFLQICAERALQKARQLDQDKAAGKPVGKLAGVPIAIKDIIHIEGLNTSCGSKFLENYKAPFSATVVELLENEGAIILGKTNLDEFAMGSSNEHSAFGPVRNPWNTDCTPGGSSGGSAAAVAARLCPIALGTDTGGSIRQPAALCGTVGLKPTYGRVSRYGLVAFASSCDQIGPLANYMEDVQMVMEVLGQHCKRDSTSLPLPVDSHLKQSDLDLSQCKVGVPSDDLLNLKEEMKENFLQVLDSLKKAGATLVPVDLDLLRYCTAVYYIIAPAEASTNLARFDGVRYGKRAENAHTLDEVYEFSKQQGFGPEVKRRVLLGTYVLSAGHKDAFYNKALKVRTLVKEQMKTAFSQCDLIALPTTPTPAFPLGTVHDGVEMYQQDIFTHAANIAGLPALNLPSGFSKENKPLGFQLMAPAKKDLLLCQAARSVEKLLSISKNLPENFR